jgi:hypothetical protein
MEKMKLNTLQNAWQAFNRATNISTIRDEKHYTEMVALADSLTDVIGSPRRAQSLLRRFDCLPQWAAPFDIAPDRLIDTLSSRHASSAGNFLTYKIR